jgi:anti-sigma B factor antagonist
MLVDFEEHNDCLVIRPRFARLDAAAAPRFRELAGARVPRHAIVVLDLHEIEGMDSTGLGTIISIVKRMPIGGSLRIARPSQAVQVLLELTHLNRVLRTFADLESALNAA